MSKICPDTKFVQILSRNNLAKRQHPNVTKSGQTLYLERNWTELSSITNPTFVQTLSKSKVCPDNVQQNILPEDKSPRWTISGQTLDMDRYWTKYGFIKIEHLSQLCPDRQYVQIMSNNTSPKTSFHCTNTLGKPWISIKMQMQDRDCPQPARGPRPARGPQPVRGPRPVFNRCSHVPWQMPTKLLSEYDR